jgi:hypothetical protein
MMKASTKFGLIILFIGIAIGAAITWAIGPFGDARVHVLEGYASTNYDGTAIGFSEKPMGDQKGYGIAGPLWRDRDGVWHDAPAYEISGYKSPTCLKPLTDNQKVRLGVVKVAPTQEAPGMPVVVWLECLD